NRKHLFHLCPEPLALLQLQPELDLSVDDDAGGDVFGPDLADIPGNRSGRSIRQVRHGVRVQQVKRHSFTSSNGNMSLSSISGNRSSGPRGSSVASTSRSVGFFLISSTISFPFSSRVIRTSSPSNSNSFGILTAW